MKSPQPYLQLVRPGLSLIVIASLAACGGGDPATEIPASGAPTAQSAADGGGRQRIQAVTGAAANRVSSQVTLNARASLLGSIGAQVEIRVNRQLVASTEIRNLVLQDQTFTVPAIAAGSVVDIVFTNDAVSGGADRNLWVRSVTIDGSIYPATSKDVVLDVGAGAAAFDGQDLRPGQEGIYWNAAMRITLPGVPQAGDGVSATSPAGFFVDGNLGNDAGPGTMAQPWRTLAKLKDARLASGQAIFLRCGQTWRESLTLTSTQLVDGIRIAGYGSECAQAKAAISGADLFSGGWTKSGNIWSRAVPAGTPKITRLFVNGSSQLLARWPNTTGSAAGYAYVDKLAAATTASVLVASADRSQLQSRDLQNAGIHMRTSAWRIVSRSIASYDAAQGLLRLDSASDYNIDPAEGYVLEGKLWMLDAPGEFFHDTAANKLYLYPADTGSQADLNQAVVEGSVRDDVLTLSDRSGLRVENLALRKGRNAGLVLRAAPAAVVDGVEASGHGSTGIYATGSASLTGPTIRNSSLDDNWHYGIDTQYAGPAQVTANTVNRTGTVASVMQSYAGISTGPGSKVQNNQVDGSGYHGIRFSGVGGSLVSGNTVSNYCTRLSDCGGLYTWNGPKTSGSGQTSTVENNQLLQASANTDGAVGAGIEVAAGIFLDDFSNGVMVRGNIVHGAPIGIMVHNSFSNTVESNQFLLNSKTGIHASMDQGDRDWMTGNVFRTNQILPLRTATAGASGLPALNDTYPIWFFHNLAGSSSISSGSNVFSGNQVIRLDGTLDGVHAWIRSNTEDSKLSSATWARFNPADAATSTSIVFVPYAMSLGSELVPGGGFDAGLGSWRSFFRSGGVGGNVVNTSGAAGCTGTCVALTVGTTDDYIHSPSFTMRPGVLHAYTYSATLSTVATLGWPYISRAASPWDSMANAAGFSSATNRSGVAGQVIRYEAFFTPKSADPARVNVQLKSIGVPVSFDNVSVREVNSISYASTGEWAALAYATTKGPATVTCASLGWGSSCSAIKPDGSPVGLPQVLTAGSSQLFLRADSNWRR